MPLVPGEPSAHASAVRALLLDEPSHADDQPAAGGRLQRLCRSAARDLSASGVGVSLLSSEGDMVSVAASDALSLRVEELQFSLGEGPCLAAFADRRPMLVPDLEQGATQRWPAYVPAAHREGVRAVFAFPLQVGVARLGALDVYRAVTGSLSEWAVLRSLAYADEALTTLLAAEQTPEQAAMLIDGGENRFEVYQAQGMLMVQLGVGADEALARLRAHAFLHDRRLAGVADDVLARRITLEKDGD